jgi:hypothetical protein
MRYESIEGWKSLSQTGRRKHNARDSSLTFISLSNIEAKTRGERDERHISTNQAIVIRSTDLETCTLSSCGWRSCLWNIRCTLPTLLWLLNHKSISSHIDCVALDSDTCSLATFPHPRPPIEWPVELVYLKHRASPPSSKDDTVF